MKTKTPNVSGRSAWLRYNKNRLGGKSRFSGVSRLFCYYRVNSSVFSGL